MFNKGCKSRSFSGDCKLVPLWNDSKFGPPVIKKVTCTHVQALRLCTGRTAHRGSRGIALPFHDHGTRRGEGSASRPGRPLPPGKNRYPLCRRLGEPQGRSGQVRKISPPTGIRFPARPARSQSLYPLSYPAHPTCNRVGKKTLESSKWFIVTYASELTGRIALVNMNIWRWEVITAHSCDHDSSHVRWVRRERCICCYRCRRVHKRKRLIIPSSVVEVLCHKFRLCYVTFTSVYMHIVGPQFTVTQLRTRSFLRPPGEQRIGLNDHCFLENLSQFINHSLVTRRHITSEASWSNPRSRDRNGATFICCMCSQSLSPLRCYGEALRPKGRALEWQISKGA